MSGRLERGHGHQGHVRRALRTRSRDRFIRAHWALLCLFAACDPRDVELVRDGRQSPGEAATVQNRGLSDALIAAFARDVDADRTDPALALAYPSAETVVPDNLTHMHYQWQAPAALDSFEVRIEAGATTLRYYTHDRDFRDDAQSSTLLAPMHSGQRVRVVVRALASASPSVVHRSEAVVLTVAAVALQGSAFYWSTTARGIKRADLSAGHATPIMTAPTAGSSATCMGCHTVSRDGSRLAVADGGSRLALFTMQDGVLQSALPDGPAPSPPDDGKGPKAMMPMMGAMPMMPMMPMMGATPVARPPPVAPPPAPGMPTEYGWGSFSPDASQLAITARGKLHILDATTGKPLPKVRMIPETSMTHPDWSPDGAWIAVAFSMSKPPKGEKLVRGSSIARLPVLADGMIGEPEVVVASTGPDDTLAYPAYSPDGRWIAFSRANGASKDNISAQLWIAPADRSGMPVLLERANRPAGGDAVSPPAAAGSMPVWAESSQPESPFLTFTSTRAYGTQLASGLRDQLWATAIDLTALAAGLDPSAPPFWLPFQDPSEDNHRALFTTNTTCMPGPELCDGRDDDCDGEIDESCCTPAAEDCADQIDNDCDGVINEGCGCSDVESCGDGHDDDCDEQVDEDCEP